MLKSQPPAKDASCYVRTGPYLAQFRRPGTWEEVWLTQSDFEVQRILRHRGTLGPHRRLFREVLPRAGVILEAGCGLGTWVSRLLRRGYSCIGLDLAVKTLTRSKALAPELPLIAGNIFTLPFADNSLSAYLSFGVVEHFREGPGRALQEAYRALRPGGVALVSVPYENPFRARAETRDEESARRDGLEFYQYYFKPGDFWDELAKAGFRPEPGQTQYLATLTALPEQAPQVGSILKKLPYPSIWALVLDKLPWLPPRAGHMILAVARKPE